MKASPPTGTASRTKVEATEPALRPGRDGGIWRSVAVVLLLAGVTVAIVLLITAWGEDESSSVPPDTPTLATPPPPAPAPATSASATPAPVRARQSERCAPIFGGGSRYSIVSSARGGTDAASCAQVRPVILGALNESTRVAGWRCAIDLGSEKIAVCRSGRRTALARR